MVNGIKISSILNHTLNAVQLFCFHPYDASQSVYGISVPTNFQFFTFFTFFFLLFFKFIFIEIENKFELNPRKIETQIKHSSA